MTDMIERAAEILSERHGAEIVIRRATLLTDDERRNALHRLELDNAAADLPRTIILKHVPESENNSLQDFLSEWVGTAFASGVPGIGPAYYGGDLELRFVLMEDLGDSDTSLVEPLLGEDPEAAIRALRQHAALLGQLHAQTVGQAADYDALYESLAGEGPDAEFADKEAAQLLSGLEQVCELYKLVLDGAARAELESVRANFTAPGPWHAFLHRDSCPDNVFRESDGLRLIDFQESRFGHVLMDAVFFRMCYPSCWCSNRLPPNLVNELEAVYRQEATSGLPQLADDDQFYTQMVEVCWVWIMITLSWLVKYAQDEDGRWGIATIRPRIFLRLERFIELAEQVEHLPALTRLAQRLLQKMREQWPETESLAVYPGLRSGAATQQD
jgi:aminoglycoside/choline kinase family phosphotransferase